MQCAIPNSHGRNLVYTSGSSNASQGDHICIGLLNMNRLLTIKNVRISLRQSSMSKVLKVHEWTYHSQKVKHVDKT